MNHRDYILIKKIISELDVADELLGSETLQNFEKDEKTKRAVCMTVINIGELIKNITDPTRQAYPKIPWKQAAGFRDIAAHKYQTLKMGDVYDTVRNDFPKLKIQLKNILNDEKDDFI